MDGTQQLSNIIGNIYDAELDPTLWPSALETYMRVCGRSSQRLGAGQLGKNGRWRSNVWCYPGVSSDSRKGLELHPTVNLAAMLTDAMLDLTHRGDIVLDPFLGSGSTLIAAHGVGRRCFGIELDPHYVDVVLSAARRSAAFPRSSKATGETFDVVAQRRQREAAKASA
jgi:hypothetical protein